MKKLMELTGGIGMDHGVLLCFDDETTDKFLDWWNRLQNAGLTVTQEADGLMPHITLAAYNDKAAEAEIEAWMQTFAEDHPPFTIHFSHLGLFKGKSGNIHFVAPTLDETLLGFHLEFHGSSTKPFGNAFTFGQLFSQSTKSAHGLYNPGLWVPHVTLCTTESYEQDRIVIEEITKDFEPFDAKASHLELFALDTLMLLSTSNLGEATAY